MEVFAKPAVAAIIEKNIDDIPTHTRDFSRELVGFLFFPPKTLRWQTCSGIIKI